MILFKSASDITNFLIKSREQGSLISFVPTMGALHPGHISLVENSKKSGYLSVCSIFVNPTQFNDIKDFDNYPATLEKDIDMLEQAGCDVLFLPSVPEMYPGGIKKVSNYELGYLETVLEGSFRPGHFQGVCQVVNRLLDIIPANELYLGQKDYQQCMVIKRMIELVHLPVKTVIRPTLREPDGLAMSSRNMRLKEDERKKAVQIFEVLSLIKNNIKPGSLEELQQTAINKLTREGFKVDYVEIANANTLELLKNWDGKTAIVALVAAFVGDIRLIDNMLL
ncbi:MAG TPA: pantoate--beta-alanine ligase [Ferruginibacter sp.]|nr:pantoate--beta-alanine ligase [Ferruginibacter sp.]